MSESVPPEEARSEPYVCVLVILAALSAFLYAGVSFLSWQFRFDTPFTQRPILVVLLLLGAAFFLYIAAVNLVRQAPSSRRLLTVIIWSAILFRVTLLFSVPIQEIDIYRYLWDGAVLAHGVSPFRFSPGQVREAPSIPRAQDDLSALGRLREEQPSFKQILQRIHYSHLPTIYPPTSQVIFAAASLTTPRDASVLERIFVMKLWLLAFELGTLFLVIGLLKLCQQPPGLCVIYGWCPLLMKETANSGHLDSIAVFFTILAIFLTVRLLARRRQPTRSHELTQATLVGLCLALAIGAKLYPVVLAPLVGLALGQAIGWRRMLLPAVVCLGGTVLVLWPMLPSLPNPQKTAPPQSAASAAVEDLPATLPPSLEEAIEDPPALPPTEAEASPVSSPKPSSPKPSSPKPSDPSLGLTTFLRRWEMNDFLFLVVVENLKLTPQTAQGPPVWFSLVPESFRQQVISFSANHTGLAKVELPFAITRALTGLVFLGIALSLAWRFGKAPRLRDFCEAGFLTLAWFWLLCPTQNPWYWTWALPLLPFARNRAWMALSGLVLLYYLRFWLLYHWPETPVLGTGYRGSAFFDFVVTWIEFGPWFVWLAVQSYFLHRQIPSADSQAFQSSSFPSSSLQP